MAITVADGRRVREDKDVIEMPRSAGGSLLQTAREEAGVSGAEARRGGASDGEVTGARPCAGLDIEPDSPEIPKYRSKLTQYVSLSPSKWKKWLSEYWKHRKDPLYPFRTYPPGDRGIRRVPDEVSVAIASDWGTGTRSAYRVSCFMREASPDITIHLGDVYYSGTAEEYRNYFLPTKAWCRGRFSTTNGSDARGTYALNANHEMYSGGSGYFGVALPELQQPTSYFCLENDYWRIVGLDTGYLCTRGIARLFGDQTELHPSELDWLQKVVFRDSSDPRPVILLTHHQWFTAFSDTDYPKIGAQLQPYLPRVVLWFWGHEHRFSGYRKFSLKGVGVRARCIGHGGMPIALDDQPSAYKWPTFSPPKLARLREATVFSDQRRARVIADGNVLGFCGFALLAFAREKLHITYQDEAGTPLLTESWTRTANGPEGVAELLVEPKNFLEKSRSISELVL